MGVAEAIRPSRAIMTEADIVAMSGDGVFELVGGSVREKMMGNEAGTIAARVASELFQQLVKKKLGRVIIEAWLRTRGPENTVNLRRADVAYVAWDHFGSRDVPDILQIDRVPTLVVEVVSPRDSAEELEEKLAEYDATGIPLVWVMYPRRRLVRVRRAGGELTELLVDDVIRDEAVLPGFSLRVVELFAPEE